MFGLHKKSNQASKPQQDVFYPFKTVFKKEQLIFGDKNILLLIGLILCRNKKNKGRDKTG